METFSSIKTGIEIMISFSFHDKSDSVPSKYCISKRLRILFGVFFHFNGQRNGQHHMDLDLELDIKLDRNLCAQHLFQETFMK